MTARAPQRTVWRRRQWMQAASLAAIGAGTAAALGGEPRPPVTALVFHPDGSELIAGSQSGVSLLDPVRMQPRDELSVLMANVHDMAFSSDGTELWIAGGYPAESGVLERYRLPEREPARSLETHRDVFTSVDLSPDGRRLLAVSADGGCSVLERQSGRAISRFDQHSRAVLAGVFLPDGETVVTAGRDQTLRVWTIADGALLRSLHNHTGDVLALALQPHESGLPMVASASADGTVRLWQPTIGRMVRFARLPSPPLCLAWHSQGRGLVAGCRDGKARLIDPQTVQISGTIDVSDGWLYAVAVHPLRQNRAAFGSTDGQVRLVEL